MKRLALICAFALPLLLTSARVSAMTIVYDVALSGSQSVPNNVTTAFGNATVTVDDVADTVGVTMSFTGLIGGPATAAHIHCCVATDSNGPVVIPFIGFPAASSATYANTFANVSAANIAGIEAGLAYINIHDAAFPAGEIRGNILASPIPEPSAAGLLLVGLAALAVLARVRPGAPARHRRPGLFGLLHIASAG